MQNLKITILGNFYYFSKWILFPEDDVRRELTVLFDITVAPQI